MCIPKFSNVPDISKNAAVDSTASHIKVEDFQNFDHGDNQNWETIKQSTISEYPQTLDVPESSKYVDHNYVHQNKVETQGEHTETLEKRPLQFTAEMIRDQELLVSSMIQQRIPEALIRRQFDRLLDEQSKQLRLMKYAKPIDKNEIVSIELKKKDEVKRNYDIQKNILDQNCLPSQVTTCNNQFTCSKCQLHNKANIQLNNDGDACEKKILEKSDIRDNSQCTPSHTLVPSSLLKIRLEKEALDSRNRNNGLQEPAKALEIINMYKHPRITSTMVEKSKNNRQQVFESLNGIQNKNNVDSVQATNNFCQLKSQKTQNSANGLNNAKNPSSSCYIQCLPIEKHVVANSEQKLHMLSGKSNQLHEESLPNQSEHYLSPIYNNYVNQDMQNNTSKNFTFDPEYQEPKIIGGLLYLAQKPRPVPRIPASLHNNCTCNHLKSTSTV